MDDIENIFKIHSASLQLDGHSAVHDVVPPPQIVDNSLVFLSL